MRASQTAHTWDVGENRSRPALSLSADFLVRVRLLASGFSTLSVGLSFKTAGTKFIAICFM